MAYFIFSNNFDNQEGFLYKIAENEFNLNNLNIDKSNYKIIEDSQSNFNLVKFGNKIPSKYNNNNNTITYVDNVTSFINKQELQEYINNFKKQINQFLKNNLNHPLYNQWNDYYNQLNNLDLNSIIYPLNKSLEQYFNDLGQLSLNHLQLP
jgi:hypothetical protein